MVVGAARKTRIISRATIPRWFIAATVLVLLAVVGQWCETAMTHPQSLGFRVRTEGAQMVVSWVQPSGLGWDAYLRPGDRLLSAEGRAVSASDDPGAITRAQTIVVQAPSGSRTASVSSTPPYGLWERIALFGIAAVFALVGAIVFVLASDIVASTVLLINSTAGALLFESLAGGTSGEPLVISIAYLATVAFGASFLLLFFVFPINWLRFRVGRYVAAVALTPSLALMMMFVVAATERPLIYTWLKSVSFIVHPADLLGAIALILLAIFRSSPEQHATRRAMKIVGIGSIAGILPFLIVLVIPHLIHVEQLASPPTAAFSMIMIPISLGIAITSRQFFGITRLLRRGLITLAIWLFLLSVLTISVQSIEQWHKGPTSLSSGTPLITAGIVAILALILWPTQVWLRTRLERALFRDVYDYQETLRQLSRELVEIRGLEAIAGYALDRLCSVLDLSWAEIELAAGNESHLFSPGSVSRGDERRASTNETLKLSAHIMPLVIKHEAIGTLSLGPKRHDVAHNPEDIALVTTLAPMIATALHSALLLRRLEEQVDVLIEREQALAALSGQLMQVQEEERRRLALDLHDDPLQRAILLARKITQTSPAFDRLRLREDAEEIINALRAICAGLRPPVLDDFGLVAGLESLISEACARSELNISFEIEEHAAPFGRLPPQLETALYRVAQEALNNCIKHAQATQVQVTLGRTTTCVNLRIQDDGHGSNTNPAFVVDSSHLGLLGMRERLQPWGGTVNIGPGEVQGTTVFVAVPLRGNYAQST